ncbi:MAG: putative ABC transport system permease protein [Sulfurimonas sp.]|jgi:putative ABC transport system permease protein|uniref:ABC transporter permease n=1 Tax=Sulfurimonas sp. TaxID=2022749 RepID=UPI0039E5CF74
MQLIPAQNIIYILLPLAIVWYFYYKWADNKTEIIYVTLRMIVQLLVIGYILIYIFENNDWYIGLLIISIMIIMSSFIAFRNINNKNIHTFFSILVSIALSGTLSLIIVIEFVLDLTQFYEPKYVVPIAGMIYANCMNAIAIAAERFETESKTSSYEQARKVSFKTSLIPKVNTFLAVGLVSLPGMMTGQILSGVSPLIAVRYQIVIMAMILGSAGISVILYLLFQKKAIH